jgi:hypothetical protein
MPVARDTRITANSPHLAPPLVIPVWVYHRRVSATLCGGSIRTVAGQTTPLVR